MQSLRKLWPRQPFLSVAFTAVAGIALAELQPNPSLGVWLFLPLALWAWARRSSLAVHIAIALLFFHVHSLRQTDSPGLRLAHAWGEPRQALSVEGLVTTVPTLSARGMSSFRLRLHWYEQAGERHPSHATVQARWRGDVRFGDTLQLFGVTHPIEGPRNPGEFDMRAYLARRDVRHALIVRYPENGRIVRRGGGNPILRAAHASRRWMQSALARGLESAPDQSSLISAMVLGTREQTADEVEEKFQQTGTIHLFSVSGLHVGIVAYLLWTIARLLRVPRRWAIGLIIPALFFYAAVTGLNTASVRAALMAAFLLGGAFFDRKVFAANSIAAAAVVILCFDTNQLFATGFQLSFAVVSMIILLADPLFRALEGWGAFDPFLPVSLLNPAQRLWLTSWRGLSRGASVSLAAWFGSLPLILPYFYLVTPVSLFANLVVVPIAFFVLAVGLLSLLAAPIAPGLTIIFNNANWSLASAILAAAGLFTRAPAGHFYLELPSRTRASPVELTALDLGAGAAIHLRTRASDWLFDCGAARDFRRIVRGYLRSRGINRLNGLLLTHADSGHMGGAESVLRAFRPRDLIAPAAPNRSSAHRAFRAFLQEEHIARQTCAAGDSLSFGRNLRLRFLYPPPGFDASNVDDEALVMQLEIDGRWRVLLMSDSGLATERALLVADTDLTSDILIKGQHHSGVSGSPEFLARVRPRLIIASSPEFPENEQVKDDWANQVAQRGITLFRQDQTGAVTLRFSPDHWEAIPFLPGEQVSSP